MNYVSQHNESVIIINVQMLFTVQIEQKRLHCQSKLWKMIDH